MNEIFDTGRFIKLCRYAVGKEEKDLIRTGIRVSIIFFFLTVFFGLAGDSRVVMEKWYFPILLLNGIYVAKSVFEELWDKDRCISWMMLPGSSFEKFFSALLYVTVLNFILLSAEYIIGVNIGCMLASLLFGYNFRIFFPLLDGSFYYDCCFYILFTSVFLTGGLYFRKHPVIKTIFFVLLIMFVIKLIILTVGIIIFHDNLEGVIQSFPLIIKYWSNTIKLYLNVLVFAVIPMSCWIISYMRIKEKEIV